MNQAEQSNYIQIASHAERIAEQIAEVLRRERGGKLHDGIISIDYAWSGRLRVQVRQDYFMEHYGERAYTIEPCGDDDDYCTYTTPSGAEIICIVSKERAAA